MVWGKMQLNQLDNLATTVKNRYKQTEIKPTSLICKNQFLPSVEAWFSNIIFETRHTSLGSGDLISSTLCETKFSIAMSFVVKEVDVVRLVMVSLFFDT